MPWSKTQAKREKEALMFEYDSPFDFTPMLSHNEHGSPQSTPKTLNEYRSVFKYSRTSDWDNANEIKASASQETRFSWIVRITISFICYAFVFMTFPVSLWLCIKKVAALERIIIFRLGRRLPLKGPGLIIVLPCVDRIVKVDLRPKTIHISPQKVLTSDGGIIEVQAGFEFHTIDVIHSVLAVKDIDNIIKQLGKCSLVNIFSSKDVEDAEQKRNMLEIILKDNMNRSLTQWGLEVTTVEIPPVRVIKAGEPPTAMKTLITAFKSSMGVSNNILGLKEASIPALPPGLVSVSLDNNATENNENKSTSRLESSSEFLQLVDILNQLTTKINTMTESLEIQNAVICLNVAENDSPLYYLISEGKASVCNSAPEGCKPDLVISSSTSTILDIMKSDISPVQAFWENRVQVEGDINLLQQFANALKEAP